MKTFKVVVILATSALVLFAGCSSANYEKNRIQPYKANKSYWQYKGEPVFLLGGNLIDNSFQLNQAELEHYLDELVSVGGNYIRNVMSDKWEGDTKAFKRLEDGKYDLSQWNEEYWQKFKYMLEYAAQRNIIVHVTLWDRFDHYDDTASRYPEQHRRWIESQWNPVNNINYTHVESRLDSTYPGHPIKGTNPFFTTPPTMENNPKVLYFQQEFIKNIMDISLEYGNVLYNMGNEHQIYLKDWDHYWCEFIRDYAATKGKKIETSAMFDYQKWQPVVERNDIYTFVEGSKVGSQWTDAGGIQYDVAVELVKSTNKIEVRPVNAVKVKTQSIVYNAQERLWRPLMAGFAALSHHRHTGGFTSGARDGKAFEGKDADNNGWPVGGLGFTSLAKTNIKSMRIFTDNIKPWECIPRQDLLRPRQELLDPREREEDRAYLFANEGEMYGLYFPKGYGSISLDLNNQKKSFKVQWIDIGKGQIVLETIIDGGTTISFEAPHKVEYGWACCITAF